MRVRARIVGQVQGVGFRPWLVRRARDLGLAGWVRNGPDGVWLEAEGPAARALIDGLSEAPAPIDAVVAEMVDLADRGEREFRIAPSDAGGAPFPTLPPDLATCPDCLAEVGDPTSRRYGYLLLSCTACGPRYSIAGGPPFDRERTAMSLFPLCAACLAEYRDPADRRYHAQATACPVCGPRLSMSVDEAAAVVRNGGILAVKGLAGFQLVCDASDEGAVQRVRATKRRPDKPLAVMVAAPDGLTDAECRALAGPDAPIVVTPATGATAARLAPSVLRGSNTVGWMLPATAMHRALLEAVGRPVVCTSANVSGEPLTATETTARPLADATWSHDRPVWRAADDPVVRSVAGRLRVLRRARGHAPRPVALGRSGAPLLAMGADLKSAVALALGDQAVLSPYLGAQGSRAMLERLEREVAGLCAAYEAFPALVVRDAHPDLVSSRVGEALAAEWGVPVREVHHHHAHVGAVCAEHGLDRPVLAFAWDGVGLGADGTVWGGEVLRVDGAACERVGHLRPFALPGGDACAREPGRMALALLHGAGLERTDVVGPVEVHERGADLWTVLGGLRETCTAMGRLLDGLAVLAGVPEALGVAGPFRTTFEGQLPIALEGLASDVPSSKHYDLAREWMDWRPWVEQVLADRRAGIPTAMIAGRIHATLVEAVVRAAGEADDVVLCGGCFQNRILVEGVVARLGEDRVWLAERVPTNDGGIALGQAWVARRWEV